MRNCYFSNVETGSLVLVRTTRSHVGQALCTLNGHLLERHLYDWKYLIRSAETEHDLLSVLVPK